ncbi:hypothetical protein Bca52824_026923 [Brassica carinata]|uniref:Reverse transcriptase zinc-binding domain-containing protein n=1 Tax=Brassica carinata TaxID=52824 RepID=A0A8X7SIK4_BRACI|nr:hypothetical protein Bca52824_026923 [Brassica carinata]
MTVSCSVMRRSWKPCMTREDSVCWGFTKDGTYSTQSGYKLLDALIDFDHPQATILSPIERQLWKNLWKIKAPQKIKHFMWRALSGALAVKERLTTRGIQVDTTCLGCGRDIESICHVLFSCDKAKEAWDLANVPIPQSGFSRNSVFLNFLHLIKVANSGTGNINTRKVFPWLLWELWKARNVLAFDNKSITAPTIAAKAFEEASLWQRANVLKGSSVSAVGERKQELPIGWIKPPRGCLKCNVGSSWMSSSPISGASWILRDEHGKTIMHS